MKIFAIEVCASLLFMVSVMASSNLQSSKNSKKFTRLAAPGTLPIPVLRQSRLSNEMFFIQQHDSLAKQHDSLAKYMTVLPSNMIVLPSNMIVLSSNKIVMSSNMTVMPSNMIVMSSAMKSLISKYSCPVKNKTEKSIV